jgi:K+-dependent Na+/Ca+ exchanger-like protein
LSLVSIFKRRRRLLLANPKVNEELVVLLVDVDTTSHDKRIVTTPHRRVLDEDICSESIPTLETPLQFAFYLLSLVYMFLASERLCDDYFLPALEEMSDAAHFNLTPDVAGATLMAMGGSASELFTNLFATLNQSDVGVGTIIGSAVFNVLVVIAACCILSTAPSSNPLTLTPWPVLRDFLFYSIGLIALAIVMASGTITFGESIILFSLYLLYVIIMYFNQRLYDCYRYYYLDRDEEINSDRTVEEDMDLELVATPVQSTTKGSSGASYERKDDPYVKVVQTDPDSNEDREGEGIDEEDDDNSSPRGFISFLKWIILIPLQVSLRYTIPTKTSHFWPFQTISYYIPHHMCYIQFCASIAWIGIFSEYTVFCTEVIGKYLSVPPVVMGLTLVAAGSSVQDLISSVIVARQGEADMAISSSIGSNIFDILVCLPLPWILYLVLHRNQTDAVMVRIISSLHATYSHFLGIHFEFVRSFVLNNNTNNRLHQRES